MPAPRKRTQPAKPRAPKKKKVKVKDTEVKVEEAPIVVPPEDKMMWEK